MTGLLVVIGVVVSASVVVGFVVRRVGRARRAEVVRWLGDDGREPM